MKLLTVKELSEITRVKEKTLYDWANKGSIPSIKLNGLLRFDLDEIEEWIKTFRIVPIQIKKSKSRTARQKNIDKIVKRAIESVKR